MMEKFSEFVSIVSDLDKEEYKIYKSPNVNEINELRGEGSIIVNAIISKKDLYIFSSNITHEEVMEKLSIKNCLELVINMVKNKVDVWIDEYNELDQNDKDTIKMLLKFGLPKLAGSTAINDQASVLIHVPEEDNMNYSYGDLAGKPVEEKKEHSPALRNKPLEWNDKSNPFMSTIDTSPTSNPTFKVPDSLIRTMASDVKRLKKTAVVKGLVDNNPVFLNPTAQEIEDANAPMKFFYFPKNDDLLLAPIEMDHYQVFSTYSNNLGLRPVYLGKLNIAGGHEITFDPKKDEAAFNRFIEKLNVLEIDTNKPWM